MQIPHSVSLTMLFLVQANIVELVIAEAYQVPSGTSH